MNSREYESSLRALVQTLDLIVEARDELGKVALSGLMMRVSLEIIDTVNRRMTGTDSPQMFSVNKILENGDYN